MNRIYYGVRALAIGLLIIAALAPLFRTSAQPVTPGQPWPGPTPQQHDFLPSVRTAGPTPIPASGWITLVDSDTTFSAQAYDPQSSRLFVTYIDRQHGNRAHLAEYKNGALYEVVEPIAVAPAFVPDADKDASVSVIIIDGRLGWFVSSRPVGETGPNYYLRVRWMVVSELVASSTPVL